MNLAQLATLGKELMRLRWEKEAHLVREAWHAMRNGQPQPDALTVTRIAGALGIGAKLEHTYKCPKCTEQRHRNVLRLPDRTVFSCEDCGAEWVSMLRQYRASLSLRAG